MKELLRKTVDVAMIDKDSKLLKWLKRVKIVYDKNDNGRIVKDGRKIYLNVGLNRWEYRAK